MNETAGFLQMMLLSASARSADARAIGSRILDQGGVSLAIEARTTALLSFADYLDAEYSESVVMAERAVALARASANTEALAYALTMRLLASAGTPWAGAIPDIDHFDSAWQTRADFDGFEPSSRLVVGHLLVEAALCTGHVTEAAELLEALTRTATGQEESDPSALPAVLRMQGVRVLYFQGKLGDARSSVEEIRRDCITSGDLLWAALSTGYLALIAANQGNRAESRKFAALMVDEAPPLTGYLLAAMFAVASYAYFAAGDLDRAADFGARAGGDVDLSRLQVGDRALTFNLLVAAALARGDLASAEEWGARSLAIAAHPAAAALVQELLARIDLARGQGASSAELAAVSAARSRLTGFYLEAAQADLVRARALASAGLVDAAAQQLIDLATGADSDGFVAISSAAASELRRLGRRVPRPAGEGWASLSERERQIAALASEGFSNQVIGDVLFLSGRTVQSYMSRILATLGVTSRTALPRVVAEHRLGSPRDDLPALTSRQWEVAQLVSDGCSNQELADRLGISVKTAEKHIGEIMQRWSVQSRTSVASLVIAETMRSAG